MQPTQSPPNASLCLPLSFPPSTPKTLKTAAGDSSSSSSFRCSRSKRRRKFERIRQRQRQRQLPHNPTANPNFIFRKSHPTPLLIGDGPSAPPTKIDALDAVVGDLESSIQSGLKVFDPQIITSLLEICFQLRALDHGIRIHGLIPDSLLRGNAGISSKLLRLYASTGRIHEAHKVFDEMRNRDASAFPWNSLISGYSELGLHHDAIALYLQMDEEGVEPDRFTFPRALKACAGIGSIQVGEAVHRHVVRLGYAHDPYVLNSLIDMYAKCGDILKARSVFSKIPCRDAVTWNTMLTAYVRHGLPFEAFKTFRQMLEDGFQPDSTAISTILVELRFPIVVAQIHGWVFRHGNEWSVSIANAFVVAYSSMGKLRLARWVFDQMPERDVVSWNSIISAHSKSPRALAYFSRMERDGPSPDAITFVSVLSACAHLGLVSRGERVHLLMREKYGVCPGMAHYACLVNVYGRAGRIEEAYGIIAKRMKFRAGATVWGALLHACRLHGNADIGEIAGEKLFELEPDNEHNFDVLMDIYGSVGRTEDVERVKKMKGDRGLDY